MKTLNQHKELNLSDSFKKKKKKLYKIRKHLKIFDFIAKK